MTAVPMLDDLTLDLVQRLDHHLDAGFVITPVAGLDGEVHQRTARRSHTIRVQGVLLGDADGAVPALEQLQQKAAAGEEVMFTADIVAALDLQTVVIRSLRIAEEAGMARRFLYDIELAESPPLPPPAEVSAFGGLGDFGFGDLGFDTDLLGDLAQLAGDIAGAVDAAVSAIGALDALASLGELGFDGVLAPLDEIGTRLGQIGSELGGAAGALGQVFST